MPQFKSARAQFIAAVTIFGTLAPFVRNIPLPSAELALYRAVMAAALLGGCLLLSKRRID